MLWLKPVAQSVAHGPDSQVCQSGTEATVERGSGPQREGLVRGHFWGLQAIQLYPRIEEESSVSALELKTWPQNKTHSTQG